MSKIDLTKPFVIKGVINKVIFYNEESNYAVLSIKVDDEATDKEICNAIGFIITAVGQMVEPKVMEEYEFHLEEVETPKYGKQYKIIYSSMGLDIKDPEDQKTILFRLYSTERVVNMYNALPNPFDTLMKGDAASLQKVRGIGPKNVVDILDVFARNVQYSAIYIELAQYQLTDTMIKTLVEAYGSPEGVIKAVKENPYALIYHVDGIGFKKADAIALKGGEDPTGLHRLEAFIYYYLKQQGESGYSWIETEELAGAIEENLGDVPPFDITEAIHEMDGANQLWYSEDHKKIGLKAYYDLENELAKQFIRIRDGKGNFECEGWEEDIKELEAKQGFDFTDEQTAAVKACFDNQVILITGGAGSGKTTCVGAMLSVYKGKYSYAQAALSGKASSRLTEVTGQKGSTIHKLLEAVPGRGFGYNSDNPLPYDIIIIDEVSMIDTRLMLALTRAIKTGSKLIMLGDVQQLEPIGVGSTANDLILSPEIKTIKLTKIHRQAAKSAIITDSISISKGVQVLPKDFVGTVTHGELADLHFDAYSDSSNTFYKIVQHFTTALTNGVDINDLAVLVPQKTKGDASVYYLNLTLQEICNPYKDLPEVVVRYDKNKTYTLRIGDKVINKKNNYRSCTRSLDGEEDDNIVPIFNGNMGRVVDIKGKQVLIDFYGIGEVWVGADHINNIELAYAITVHSAQGSEFDHVIVGIDYNAYSMLSRQLLYTAITRAKKDCIVCCQTSAFRFGTFTNHISDKKTHLKECLYAIDHPQF